NLPTRRSIMILRSSRLHRPFSWMRCIRTAAALYVALMIFVSTTYAFFPSRSTTSTPVSGSTGGSSGGGECGGGGNGGSGGGGGGSGGGGSGGSVPELDPGAMTAAFGLFMTGALMLTERRRRQA